MVWSPGRILAVVAALYLAGLGLVGLWRRELPVTLQTVRGGVRQPPLRGRAAVLASVGLLGAAAVVLVLFLGR